MKIAVATKDHWTHVSGHAGQARDWLVFDCQPGAPLTALQKIMAGEALADTRFDLTTTLCKLRDLFSRH